MANHQHTADRYCAVCELGEDNYARSALEIIDRHGWMVQGVYGSDSSTEPAFAYSVGLTRFALPEIIMVLPIPLPTMMALINNAARKMRSQGAFKDWSQSDEIMADNSVIFRELTQRSITANCGVLRWLMGDRQVRMLHMIAPDRAGLFPWNSACTLRIQFAKHLKYIVPKVPNPLIEAARSSAKR